MRSIENLKSNLSLTKGERNGFMVLCIGMLLGLIGVIYFQWIYEPDPPDLSAYQEQIDAFIAAQGSSEEEEVEQKDLFPFDPNTLDSTGWSRLGFSGRQVASILKFRRKGGTFRKKEDVQRLYVVDEERYLELEPYIDLQEQTTFSQKRYERNWPDKQDLPKEDLDESPLPEERTDVAPELVMVELNSATEADLMKVRGIGQKTATQIIKYRTWLGGFVDKEQLNEVYAFKNFPDHLPIVMEQVHVDPRSVLKINVNTVDAFELGGHPYIEKKVAGALVAYRKNHGNYATLQDIKKCALIDDALFRKIAPYLSVD